MRAASVLCEQDEAGMWARDERKRRERERESESAAAESPVGQLVGAWLSPEAAGAEMTERGRTQR